MTLKEEKSAMDRPNHSHVFKRIAGQEKIIKFTEKYRK